MSENTNFQEGCDLVLKVKKARLHPFWLENTEKSFKIYNKRTLSKTSEILILDVGEN